MFGSVSLEASYKVSVELKQEILVGAFDGAAYPDGWSEAVRQVLE